MIELSKLKPLGTGAHRKCYVHPGDPARCIKIVYDTSERAAKETRREQQYYRHLARTLRDWSGIPRFYGTVETDLGPGYVFDLVCDEDGSPSKTLKQWIEACADSGEAARIAETIGRLHRYLQDNLIVTLELQPYNVMCRRTGTGTVPVICDNMGERALVPLSFWLRSVCLNKQRRRWAQFLRGKLVAQFLERYRIDPASL